MYKIFNKYENLTLIIYDTQFSYTTVNWNPTGALWVDNIPKLKNNYTEYEICKAKDSFIFSFKVKNNFKAPILKRVKNIDDALFGPAFNHDLILGVKDENCFKEYDTCYCMQQGYEKKIRDTDKFLIEDYEVFQIVEKEV